MTTRLVHLLLVVLMAVAAITATPARNPRGIPTSAGGGGTVGVWVDVTPAGVDLNNDLPCGNFGSETVVVDYTRPNIMYTEFNCQGIWKSTDFGLTWTGPINTGTNGSSVSDCAGGITLVPNGATQTIFEACIRGNIGLWKSTDGGVNWALETIAPTPTRQDYYPPVIDPYNSLHMLMVGHEMDEIVQSTDGGVTWTAVNIASGMIQGAGTGAIFFIDTGVQSSTATTFLWLAQETGGSIGTWRTTNGGTSWTQVDTNEHPHGLTNIYQPDKTGVLYMVGSYSTHGFGILRSTDYGVTWAHEGASAGEAIIWGTPANVYAEYGWPIGAGGTVDPALQVGAQPGTGSYAQPGTPMAMTQGPGSVANTNNGNNNIFVTANYNAGLWRYVEAAPTIGTWIDVTPANINLVTDPGCGNFGTKSVVTDSSHPNRAYTTWMCQGIYVSYTWGQTWTGPINTGTGGSTVTNCAGTITVTPTSSSTEPDMYLACIRGNIGFYKSTDGGVSWTLENVAPVAGGTGQQFYAPVVDPYDTSHLLMAVHTLNQLVQSTDGGVTWTLANTDPGMNMSGGTWGIEFIDTGSSSTTRNTWLCAAAAAGGSIGTWRTTNGGTSWAQVDNGEHQTGEFQTYQPDTSGKLYMPEIYSSLGSGVLYSTNYGATWTHEGNNTPMGIIVGTAKSLYSADGFGVGPGNTYPPNLQTAVPPGTGSWASPTTPGGMNQGPAQGLVLNNGPNNIVILANYNAGMWLYVEP